MLKVINNNIRILFRFENFDKVTSFFISLDIYARKGANRFFELIVWVEAYNIGKIFIILNILAKLEVQSRMLTAAWTSSELRQKICGPLVFFGKK